MSWTIERKHDHVAVVTMKTNKVNAQIRRSSVTSTPHSTGSKASSATVP